MTDLEILAQWHDYEAADCNNTPRFRHHTDAAATIRAAMAEIERLRGVLHSTINLAEAYAKALMPPAPTSHPRIKEPTA